MCNPYYIISSSVHHKIQVVYFQINLSHKNDKLFKLLHISGFHEIFWKHQHICYNLGHPWLHLTEVNKQAYKQLTYFGDTTQYNTYINFTQKQLVYFKTEQ